MSECPHRGISSATTAGSCFGAGSGVEGGKFGRLTRSPNPNPRRTKIGFRGIFHYTLRSSLSTLYYRNPTTTSRRDLDSEMHLFRRHMSVVEKCNCSRAVLGRMGLGFRGLGRFVAFQSQLVLLAWHVIPLSVCSRA